MRINNRIKLTIKVYCLGKLHLICRKMDDNNCWSNKTRLYMILEMEKHIKTLRNEYII